MDIIAKQFESAFPSDLLILTAYKAEKGYQLSEEAGLVNKELGGLLDQLLKQEGFEGKMGEWFVFPTLGKAKAKRIGILGLGARKALNLDVMRKAGAFMVRKGREVKAKQVTTFLGNVVGKPVRDVAQALGEGVRLGAYRFHTYKGKIAQDANRHEVKTFMILEREKSRLMHIDRGLQDANVLAEAAILTRNLVNTPSMEMTPQAMQQVAETVARSSSLISLKTLDADKMEKMGMRAALAVGRGSQHPPVGVHLTYRPKGKAKKRVILVGKAVTFDSGGLSLKPADSMMTMKCDMAGAATVLGIFQALPHVHPELEIHGIFLAVENMPSGTAYRPGDVVKAMNGTTIEILNTDAEGRVTLADALSYADKFKPDILIDLATLTGACVVALGEEVAGIMSNDKKLTERLLKAAEETGEPLWELPLFEPYQDLIKSKVGDVKNIGGRWGGALTAGLFLSHFVGKNVWAHLDIAGPAYAEKETRPDTPFGGTGYGVRLLLRYLQGLG